MAGMYRGVPVGRSGHHFLESLAFVDLVMAVAVKHDKLFRFPCAGVKRSTLSWRDQPEVMNRIGRGAILYRKRSRRLTMESLHCLFAMPQRLAARCSVSTSMT